MRVAMLHYHLRSGGVSRVIESAVRELEGRAVRVAILSGEPPPPGHPLHERVRVIPNLAYRAQGEGASSEVIAREIQQVAREALGGEPDVLHVHNHSLGKNPALTRAVRQLADAGQRLLLQIHDFAEDGRPEQFAALRDELSSSDLEALGPQLYPGAPHVHYAVLNRRDSRALGAGGLDPALIHLLPNPVETLGTAPPSRPAEPARVIYPVRPIRRKNVGEFLLWSSCAEEGARFGMTLAPHSPPDIARYMKWKDFSHRHSLPVDFEVGLNTNQTYAEIMRSARVAMTTSIAEGFGMSFFEPWLVGCPVVGRLIPEITDEFEEQGIVFPGSYRRLDVPLEWVGLDRFHERLRAAMVKAHEVYGRPWTESEVARGLRACMQSDEVDFGRLDEDMQMDVIARLLREPDHPLAQKLRVPYQEVMAVRARNREQIQISYGPRAYGDRLADLYARVAASPSGKVESGTDESRILDFFVCPERVYLLRT